MTHNFYDAQSKIISSVFFLKKKSKIFAHSNEWKRNEKFLNNRAFVYLQVALTFQSASASWCVLREPSCDNLIW